MGKSLEMLVSEKNMRRKNPCLNGHIELCDFTFTTSIGLVSAVATAPENAPDAILTKTLVEPNARSQACLEGSYKPKRRPP